MLSLLTTDEVVGDFNEAAAMTTILRPKFQLPTKHCITLKSLDE